MELSELTRRALAVRQKYAAFEESRYGRSWTEEEIALGFVGDVGDLMKLVTAKSGVRTTENLDEKLAHELADCLWCLLVLADRYGVNLEEAFLDTMDELDARF